MQPMNETVGLFKYLDESKLVFFEDCLVLLTPPIYLNDPLDFLPKGRIPSEDEILKAWQENERDTVLSSVVHLPTDFALRAQQDRLTATRAHLTTTEVVTRYGEHYQKAISGIYGIVSLTEAHLSRLMWAHYARSHAGFVAEFAAGEETEADGFTRRSCAVGPELFAVKVNYPPSFQLPSFSKNAENVLEVCCTKHPLWEYEKEWRIIAPLEKSIVYPPISNTGSEVDKWYCLPFDPKNLRRVIFGMRMKPEVKQQLCCMLDQENFRHVQKQTTGINPKTGELVLHPFESA